MGQARWKWWLDGQAYICHWINSYEIAGEVRILKGFLRIFEAINLRWAFKQVYKKQTRYRTVTMHYNLCVYCSNIHEGNPEEVPGKVTIIRLMDHPYLVIQRDYPTRVKNHNRKYCRSTADYISWRLKTTPGTTLWKCSTRDADMSILMVLLRTRGHLNVSPRCHVDVEIFDRWGDHGSIRWPVNHG